MASDTELTRLATMAAALRPDWHARSVRQILARSPYRERAYADLGLALAWICLDPESQTPARINEWGPWWLATRFNAGRSEVPDVGPGRDVPACQVPGHEHEAAHHCRACRAEELAGDEPTQPGRIVSAPSTWRTAARLENAR